MKNNKRHSISYKYNSALNLYKPDLTTYEKEEILKYQEIYYFGSIDNKVANQMGLENFDITRGEIILAKTFTLAKIRNSKFITKEILGWKKMLFIIKSTCFNEL